MKIAEKEKGNNPSCIHQWVRRDKLRVEVLHRVCTMCGAEEYHSENANITKEMIQALTKESG